MSNKNWNEETLNKMKYKDIVILRKELLKFKSPSMFIVNLFYFLNKVNEKSSFTYKELLSSKIKQIHK